MPLRNKRNFLAGLALAGAFCTAAILARADEIRLKDGKKLHGVIVAYEDNMFKVKTDFGFVLVEKDKIAAIIPDTPVGAPKADAAKTQTPATPKKEVAAARPKPVPNPKPTAQQASAVSRNTAPAAKDTSAPREGEPVAVASTPAAVPVASEPPPVEPERPAPKILNGKVKPVLPSNIPAAKAVAPEIKGASTTPSANLGTQPSPTAPPKEAEGEAIQGNFYTNYSHGFRMYKAPSWNLIVDARKALPNAIVAMGTFNESTLMVVGEEKTKEPLETAAITVEKRLRDIYENYRRISQKKTVVGGLPAIEYRYRGLADQQDWSGTLVVVARGSEVFTVLGMTYADTDLIQIQENVIARTIASLDFNARP